MGNTQKPVVFELPDGTEVSNDPRHAEEEMHKQFLANLTASQDFLAEVRAGTQQSKEEPTADPDDDDDDADDDDDDDSTSVEVSEDLDKMKADALKDEVARLREAGVEINTDGISNKGELVKEIRRAVEAHNAS